MNRAVSTQNGIAKSLQPRRSLPLISQGFRERDRERAQARNSGKGKAKDDGLTREQRRERDAKALQEKAARKAAQAAGGGNAGGKSSNKN
ncbi:hypothetical protein NMG60_11017389 [Bertholletia excelsa]